MFGHRWRESIRAGGSCVLALAISLLIGCFVLPANSVFANDLFETQASQEEYTVETEDGSVLKWKKDGAQAKITGYESVTENLIIPSKIEDRDVIALCDQYISSGSSIMLIPNSTFANCLELKTVYIPDSVKFLSGMDFSGCENLESIRMPDGLVYMGMSTFNSCKSLKSISLPSMLSLPKATFGSYAFTSCTSLESVKLPDGLTSIPEGTFAGCTALKNIALPSSLKSIGSTAFEYTAVDSMTFPESVTSIGKMAFWECPNLAVARIKNRSTTFGEDAFDKSALLIIPKSNSGLRSWAKAHGNTYIAGDLSDYYNRPARVEYQYDGTEHRPSIELRNYYGDIFPLAYADVVYSNNINAGEGSYTVTSPYVDGHQSDWFRIRPVDLSSCVYDEIPDQYYSGTDPEPDVCLWYGSMRLQPGVDYSSNYFIKLSEGSGSVTIEGKNNYIGTLKLGYRVVRKPVTISFEANGGSEIPSITTGYGSFISLWDIKPTKPGREFDGWYRDQRFTQYVSGLDAVDDVTLYAKWNAIVGWNQEDSKWYYGFSNGTSAIGWTKLDHSWYYFDSNGAMCTDWVEVDGSRYYLGSDGVMRTGWQKIAGDWYYLGLDGVMRAGWQNVSGTWYWFEETGVMSTGWTEVDGSWYFFDSSGAMKSGWQNIGGAWYWLGGSGAMATGWKKVGGSWYWFGESGAMRTRWAEVGDSWYWLGSDGVMRTGWQSINGTWYWLDTSGAMATGFADVGGARYHFAASGAMSTGWFQAGSDWYLADPSGALYRSRWSGDYYLHSDGCMAVDEWVGGYYVGPDGRWVPGA